MLRSEIRTESKLRTLFLVAGFSAVVGGAALMGFAARARRLLAINKGRSTDRLTGV